MNSAEANAVACPRCASVIAPESSFCPKCGQALTHEGNFVAHNVVTGDKTGGIIPYKNAAALIGYYCAVFSLIPCIGIAPGIVAVVFGVKGYKAYKVSPQIRGSVHAWIGILLGGAMTLLWGGLFLFSLLSGFIRK